MMGKKHGGTGFFRCRLVGAAFLSVALFGAQPLLAEAEGASPETPEAETVTAFEILESHVQGRAVALQTTDRGVAAFGVVAGIGLSVGLTWGGLLPAINGWDPSDPEFDGYGILFGLAAGGAAQILAVSMAYLAHPRDDMRSVYSSVLDVVDPAAREKTALRALEGFSEKSRKRRRLGGFLSFVTVSAPVAAYVGISALMGNLAEYDVLALGFSAGAGLVLLTSLYYLVPFDEQAGLYTSYLRSQP
jgi:hypothetical protein